MAKQIEKKLDRSVWAGIDETAFLDTPLLEEVDIADYNKENMTLYAANVNLWRQLLRLSDSLKPVERRLLYSMYKHHALPGNKMKCQMIVGYTMQLHAHGDSYLSLVGMAQNWKRQVPLIAGKGNFGSAANDFIAAARYTEASLSKYAKECFFDDYDADCVEMVFNSASDQMEPMSLPSKFPNILVNGGMGIAFGNAFRIPTYNIADIIDACKKVIVAPETANVYMIPDLPSGCQVIDDGKCFHDITETGTGVMKMRADAEIIDGGKNWIIKFTSVPWMVSLQNINDKLAELGRAGILPIKDLRDHSYPYKTKDGSFVTQVDYRVIIDKAHDPNIILDRIYKNTEFQKSVSIQFKVVQDDLSIKCLNMRQLINAWLDERRSYKRRLFNKRLTRISARIDLLTVLIYLLQKDNVEKTVSIIRNANSDEAITKLMKLGKMTSYQAQQIYDMRLSAFTKDARQKYIDEKEKLEAELKELMKTIRDEKRIDKIIEDELEDLRKYGSPRKSKIVDENLGYEIADTRHNVVITNGGLIKKLGFGPGAKASAMGSFKPGDYPIKQITIDNKSELTFVDSFGRFSTVPVHQIDNTEASNYGHKIFDVTKLAGKIVSCFESFDNDAIETLRSKVGEPYLVTVTKRGYAKKTKLSVYTEIKNTKNVRAMKVRDDDSLASAQILFDRTGIIIYTRKGDYVMLRVEDIPEQGKDSMGVIGIRVNDDDAVSAIGVIGDNDSDVFVVSEKGMGKRIQRKYLGSFARRGNTRDQANIMSLDTTDRIAYVGGMSPADEIVIIAKNAFFELKYDEIPDATKKSKGKKLISTSSNQNIVSVYVHTPTRHTID